MFRNTQNKIILLVTLIALVMIAGLFLLRDSDENKLKMLLSERKKEYALLLDNVIDFKSKSLQTLAYDYTYWDEMVDFVKSGNNKWASQNIVVALPTYNADFAWVYKTDFSLVYSTNRLETHYLPELPFGKNILTQIVSKGGLYHFFVLTDVGLIEISGASIHPSADVKRKTPPQGYFFVGRIWTEAYLAEISSMMRSKTHLLPLGKESPDEKEEISQEFMVSNIKALKGWNGLPIINVCSINESVIAKEIKSQSDTQFVVLIIFSVVIILSLSYILFRFVNRPLNIISQSLATSNPNIIRDLQKEKNEFGNLANLINDFFIQKEKLEREIAEREQAEEQLKKSLSLLSATLNSTTDGILVVDEAGKISGYNNRFVNLWRIPKDIIDSRDDSRALDFVLDQLKDPDIFIAKVKDLYARPEADSFDILEFKDGRTFERYSLPQRIEGRTVGRVWSFRDVTERKQTEEALKRSEEKVRHSQKMESIGTLAGGIAHDFNNLLAIIMGHASLLEMTKDKPQKVMQSAEVIKKAVNRGAGLVNQILTFARKTDIRMESVDVKLVIDELVIFLQQTFSKAIKINAHFGKNIPSITADYNQIHQALLNISINARDAMPHGGTLSFTTKVVSKKELKHFFSEASELHYVCISVKDTGSGIDEQTRKRIFEPFFTTKEFGKGTGLGLATVYGIMHGHRGFIDIDSKIGIGTTFHLYFPLNPDETEIDRQTQEAEVEIKGGRETLLVVEDEEMLLELLTEILVSKGYNVLSARDGLEGIDVYAAHKDDISLVLTDMGLPKLSGFDMFVKLKKINPDILTIFASGFLEPKTISEMYKAGAKEFIQKPYETEDVLSKIRNVIDMNITS